MKVLCHVGPWCVEQFRAIVDGMSSSANSILVSGFKEIDETGLVREYYKYFDSSENLTAWHSDCDLEIIQRCRLLRSLDIDQAQRHVVAMRRAVREMLLRVKPAVFLCESIDQFLHDILFREANNLNIPTFGLIRTFVDGYLRISERGEMVKDRTPEKHEIQTIRRKLITDSYIPSNLTKLKKSPFITYIRIMVSNILRTKYFFLKRYLSGQKYNYHYWVSERGTREVYQHFLPKLRFGNADWLSSVEAAKKPVIYVPLQHFPEATIDYWCPNVSDIDYPTRLPFWLNKLCTDFHVLVKEHPGVWGYRKPSFYRRIENIEGITVCPTNENSHACINASDAVLVWTGTVGFEAALRGKPVLTIGDPYYAKYDRFLKVKEDSTATEIRAFIDKCNAKPTTAPEQDALIKHLLEGIIPGRFQNDGSYESSSAVDVTDAHNIGNELASILKKRSTTT